MREADRVASEQHVQRNTHTSQINDLRAVTGHQQAMPTSQARGRTSVSASPHRFEKIGLTFVSLSGLPLRDVGLFR